MDTVDLPEERDESVAVDEAANTGSFAVVEAEPASAEADDDNESGDGGMPESDSYARI